MHLASFPCCSQQIPPAERAEDEETPAWPWHPPHHQGTHGLLHGELFGGANGARAVPSDRASPRHRARSRAAQPAPKAPPAARLGGHPAGAMPRELPTQGASTGPYSPLPAALPKGTERAGPVVPAQHREPASPGAHRCPRRGTDPTRRSPTHTAFVRGRPANRALDTAPGPQPAQQHLIPLSQKPVCSLTS